MTTARASGVWETLNLADEHFGCRERLGDRQEVGEVYTGHLGPCQVFTVGWGLQVLYGLGHCIHVSVVERYVGANGQPTPCSTRGVLPTRLRIVLRARSPR